MKKLILAIAIIASAFVVNACNSSGAVAKDAVGIMNESSDFAMAEAEKFVVIMETISTMSDAEFAETMAQFGPLLRESAKNIQDKHAKKIDELMERGLNAAYNLAEKRERMRSLEAIIESSLEDIAMDMSRNAEKTARRIRKAHR